jgi:hypothetical protein
MKNIKYSSLENGKNILMGDPFSHREDETCQYL